MNGENQRRSQIIEDSWQQLAPNWSAEAKSKYYHDIYLPMVSCADEVYYNNVSLESYSENCLNSL